MAAYLTEVSELRSRLDSGYEEITSGSAKLMMARRSSVRQDEAGSLLGDWTAKQQLGKRKTAATRKKNLRVAVMGV